MNKTINLDESKYKTFENICSQLGINPEIAFNMFMANVVNEKGINLNLFTDEISESEYNEKLKRSLKNAENNVFFELSQEELMTYA